MSDETTRLMGDYQIQGVLGAGGMGRVYRVRNVITGRTEAMKVLLPDLEGQEEVAARFLREIKVLAALNHPNIAALHTALTIENQLVMIMEFVEGQTIASRLHEGAIPAEDALNYMDQVLNALSYAHAQHVIHRDIKPANMMLTSDGVVKLMDFGIARTDEEPSKLTAPGSTLGSINYMSPEQVKGESIDERSDLYSVGISLYEMVTGQKPFHGDSNFSIMAAHLQQAPTPPVELHPGLPEALNGLILTSIAKSPNDRFQSADAMRNAVRNVKQSLQDAMTRVQTPTAALRNASIAAANVRTATSAPAVPAPTRSQPAVPLTSSVPYTPTPTAPPASHRGLYMTLGAVIVLVVLVAAGIYIPKSTRAAGGGSTTPATATQTVTPQVITPAPQSTPAPAQPTVADTTPTPATDATPTRAPKPEPKLLARNKSATEGQMSVPPSNSASGANAAAAARELDEVEHQIDQLDSRVAAVNNGLDHLAQQQASAGYGLRGDIASKQSSMKVNLAKAQNAIEHNDAARAKRYADLAEADVEALEKFLGR